MFVGVWQGVEGALTFGGVCWNVARCSECSGVCWSVAGRRGGLGVWLGVPRCGRVRCGGVC